MTFRDTNQTRQSRLVWMLAVGFGTFLLSLLLVNSATGPSVFPQFISESFAFVDWVNDAEDWLKKNYRWFTRMIAGGIEEVLYTVEDFFLLSPWLFVVGLMVLPALRYGGLPLALLTLIGALFWNGVGLWDSAMQTLALMGLAVIMSVVIGLAVGVWCSQSNRAEAVIKPILDTMQTMPSFVYLLPAVFFFGIGGPPAIIATMIYALPPVIRLTSLGIRQVPANTIEAAVSYGSTPRQLLFKVQIPLALPSIMMGINQTIMMALGLVVLATFIGAEGLGSEVWKAIYKLKVGWALEAGLCIVFMAVIFDRLSLALAAPKQGDYKGDRIRFRMLPQSWQYNALALAMETTINVVWQLVARGSAYWVEMWVWIGFFLLKFVNVQLAQSYSAWVRRYAFFISSVGFLALVWLLDANGFAFSAYENWEFSMRQPVDEMVAWLTVNPVFIAFTKGLKSIVYYYMLHPLDVYLTNLPWYFVIGVFVVVGWLSAGLRFALICLVLLLFIGASDLWEEAMLTLSSVLVSVLICFIFGMPLGILTARSKRADMVLRPILDAMQTLPSFVYLIPVLMFFGGNIVSAVIATVIYALPPVIRLTSLGISQIPETYNEVSTSFGSNTRQSLTKVQLPMALPSVMLGFNQAVMMALAMQVVTPLIGGGGLGREVFNALNLSNTGAGLASGIGIVLLAIILDRLSQAWSAKQRQALGY
ncbi:MAG: ABC transporter permease subunit [Gammaproteobacteria bacterium]|nr:ABC transporter permease subunit [Gammaproteobacteria bacterium]